MADPLWKTVAQILTGVTFVFYGIIGIMVLHYRRQKISFYSFKIGFPIWAALSFIFSESVTVVSAKKRTKALLRGNVRANTLSTTVSDVGILLSNNLIKIIFLDCNRDLCPGIKSVATGLMVILIILNCLQFSITLSLSILTYNAGGERTDQVSGSPYQGLLSQLSFYKNLKKKDTVLHYNT
ncbi:high affinity immunoglobulin epsilon receptor subunit beta-like [Neovison vison]|uniref:high affinity immunoglobulin epsilon receptor subunit beta-like n=1 Tax=Neovison vison TaxID=452646 RepID=UPI001CF0CC9A|nr:high affinity immunoglobulin epsilon receptor subunit beta-like [Neogale vison]